MENAQFWWSLFPWCQLYIALFHNTQHTVLTRCQFLGTFYTAWCDSNRCFSSNSSSCTFLTLYNLEPCCDIFFYVDGEKVPLKLLRHIRCNFKSTLLFSKVYKGTDGTLIRYKSHFFWVRTHTLSPSGPFISECIVILLYFDVMWCFVAGGSNWDFWYVFETRNNLFYLLKGICMLTLRYIMYVTGCLLVRTSSQVTGSLWSNKQNTVVCYIMNH
jgi:hypothetical protein